MQEEKQWVEEGLINEDQLKKMLAIKSGKLFSIYWELQFALYAGVVMFTTGIGILIYKYIGSAGHILAIFLLMTASCAGYYYIFKKAPDYSRKKVDPPNNYFDYITLLSSLLLVLTITYIEVQFEVFGDRWTYIPLVTSFIYGFIAYRFDHKGILGLAILSLSSFFGLNLQPDLFSMDEVFNSRTLSFTGICLGITLIFIGLFTDKKKIKSHFKDLYMNLAAWLIFWGSLAGMYDSGAISIFTLIGLLASAAGLYYSWIEKSTWFAVYGSVLSYVIVTSIIIFFVHYDFLAIMWLYFMLTPIAPIMIVVKFNKHFKE